MEKTAREVIKDTIGISVDAGDITPMDYGECVKCMELYATLHSSQLKEELSALREELENEKSKNKQWRDMVNPILEWGQSSESKIQLGQSITKVVLHRAKDWHSLREENERLRKALEPLEDFASEVCYREPYFDRPVFGYNGQTLYVWQLEKILSALRPSHNTEEKLL
jgi:hypothetical protein